MLKQNTAIQYREAVHAEVDLGSEVNRLAITTLAIAAGLVGAWTAARIVSAMYLSGGPVALFQAWLSAVSGGM